MMLSAVRVALFILCVQQLLAASSSAAFVFWNQRCAYSASCHLSLASSDDIVIQQINQDSKDDLEEFSTFCIDMFHNNNKGESFSFVSRKWKDLKLAMLQKAQMIDLSVPFNGNRSVFIARACNNPDKLKEIIGCCEVIEERIVISQGQNARVRPIIENLAVKEQYRRQGVGKALLETCERNVQTWIPFHDDVFAQVEDGNSKARDFFINCGYEVVFSDTDCKKDDLEGLAFRQSKITKFMLRKVL
jgi:ribosomal protein S18 acetylase RimI-like enzyme